MHRNDRGDSDGESSDVEVEVSGQWKGAVFRERCKVTSAATDTGAWSNP